MDRLREQVQPADDKPPEVVVYIPWNFRDGPCPPYDGGPVYLYDPDQGRPWELADER
jgi:hypothetical protein